LEETTLSLKLPQEPIQRGELTPESLLVPTQAILLPGDVIADPGNLAGHTVFAKRESPAYDIIQRVYSRHERLGQAGRRSMVGEECLHGAVICAQGGGQLSIVDCQRSISLSLESDLPDAAIGGGSADRG